MWVVKDHGMNDRVIRNLKPKVIMIYGPMGRVLVGWS